MQLFIVSASDQFLSLPIQTPTTASLAHGSLVLNQLKEKSRPRLLQLPFDFLSFKNKKRKKDPSVCSRWRSLDQESVSQFADAKIPSFAACPNFPASVNPENKVGCGVCASSLLEETSPLARVGRRTGANDRSSCKESAVAILGGSQLKEKSRLRLSQLPLVLCKEGGRAWS